MQVIDDIFFKDQYNILGNQYKIKEEKRKFSSTKLALPMDPVPSMMAVTVARARELPCSDGWVPKSADTAVVMSAYGPFTNIPTISNNTEKKTVREGRYMVCFIVTCIISWFHTR